MHLILGGFMKLKLFFSLIGLSFALAIYAEELEDNSYAKTNFLAASSFTNFNKPKSKRYEQPEPTLSPQEQSFQTTLLAQFFYWKVVHDISYGRSGEGISNIPPTTTDSEFTVTEPGKSFTPNKKWEPGFRLGLKFNMGENNLYDLLLRYSWISPSLKGNFADPGIPFPSYRVNNFLNMPSPGNIEIYEATIKDDTTFNWFDLIAGYTFKMKNFSFHPCFGLTGFYDTNHLKVYYRFNDFGGPPEVRVHHESKATTCGIGPLMGFDYFFHCVKGFGFFGQATAALLWGWQDVWCENNLERDFTPRPIEYYTIVKGKQNFQEVGFKYNALLGPRLDIWSDDESFHFYAFVALELQMIPGGLEVLYLDANNDKVDDSITCQGFTGEIGFQF